MSFIEYIQSCLLYITSCFYDNSYDPYHVREMMEKNPRKYSFDTDSIILDIDVDDDASSRTETSLSRELNHRVSKHKEYIEDSPYYIQRTTSKRSFGPVHESGIVKGGIHGRGGGTDSDMSEVVPIIGGESEESTILHTFWRNIRGVIRDSIDEDDDKKEDIFVVDMDTVVL